MTQPAVTDQEKTPRAADRELLREVRAALASAGAEPTPARVAAALRAEGRVLGDRAVLDIVDELQRELTGLGPLEPLLAEPHVTDVLVHGPDDVWVDRGGGLERAPVRFPDDETVRRFAQRLAGLVGRRLDDAAPYTDARLPNGIRFHAVLAPISTRGTCLSLRVPPRRAFTLTELVDAGTVPTAGAALLRKLVEARLAYLVSGGTGCGKTTLLASLLSLVPPAERLVLVEDSGELAPAHPHVVQLESRPPNLEGCGEITLRTLVRQALRMRPDRLVVGEVRGSEVVELLGALNTGHEGGCGTLHANSAVEVPARVEALGVTAGLTRRAVHSQLAAAVDVVVHLARAADGRRCVAEICVLERSEDGVVTANEAVRFDHDSDPAASGYGYREGPGMPRLRALLGDER